jgi:hypothetical protein
MELEEKSNVISSQGDKSELLADGLFLNEMVDKLEELPPIESPAIVCGKWGCLVS